MQETNAGGTRNYNYDHRGNLLSVTSGEEVLKAYGFDAANRMSSSVDRTAGEITKAYYQYNGLGHRSFFSRERSAETERPSEYSRGNIIAELEQHAAL